MVRTVHMAAALVAVGMMVQSVWSAQIAQPSRSVSASFVGVDPYGDDPPFGSDSDSTTAFGQWRADLNLSGGGASADVSQDSDVSPGSLTFWAYGYTTSQLYVQGSASSNAASSFRFRFKLNNSGRLVLDGSVIGVAEFVGNNFSHDTPGQAQIVLRVVDLSTGRNIYRVIRKMNGYINNPNNIDEFRFEDDDAAIELAAGNYRLIIEASSSDSANNEQVAGSLANAFFEVEGRVEED